MSTFSWSQWILSWLLLVFSLIAYALFCILFSHPFQMGGGLYYRCRAMFFTEFMLNGWSMGSWDKTCGTQYKKFLGRRFIRWSQNIYIYRYKAQKIKKKKSKQGRRRKGICLFLKWMYKCCTELMLSPKRVCISFYLLWRLLCFVATIFRFLTLIALNYYT